MIQDKLKNKLQCRMPSLAHGPSTICTMMKTSLCLSLCIRCRLYVHPQQLQVLIWRRSAPLPTCCYTSKIDFRPKNTVCSAVQQAVGTYKIQEVQGAGSGPFPPRNLQIALMQTSQQELCSHFYTAAREGVNFLRLCCCCCCCCCWYWLLGCCWSLWRRAFRSC